MTQRPLHIIVWICTASTLVLCVLIFLNIHALNQTMVLQRKIVDNGDRLVQRYDALCNRLDTTIVWHERLDSAVTSYVTTLSHTQHWLAR